MRRRIQLAISLGDITGIGPEVTLKALAQQPAGQSFRFVVIGDGAHIRHLSRQLNLDLPLETYAGPDAGTEAVQVLDPGKEPLPAGLDPGAAPAANAAFQWLHEGARLCLAGECKGLITAPVNKEAIVNAGHSFVGQTELLSGLAGANRTAMMLLGHDGRQRWLRVALATTHLPIRRVADAITPGKVTLAIELAARACSDLDLPRRRVAVCGLNPHAGEGGKIGTEEQTVIAPACEAARQRGLDVVGPMSADALFYYAYRGDFDAVVAMYHDQGLGPLKMVAFEHGINWTLGLPFIRTSPDHGTAYNIAGQGIAESSSMTAAIELAKKLACKTHV